MFSSKSVNPVKNVHCSTQFMAAGKIYPLSRLTGKQDGLTQHGRWHHGRASKMGCHTTADGTTAAGTTAATTTTTNVVTADSDNYQIAAFNQVCLVKTLHFSAFSRSLTGSPRQT
jgi:hypothetical protein